MAEIYVNLNWTDEAAFNADTEKPSGLIWGSTAFNSLSAAVKAASTTEETTIVVDEGSYDDDVYLRTKNFPAVGGSIQVPDGEIIEQKGDIVVKAADGATVTFTGQWFCGERVSGSSGVDTWQAGLTFEGITFDSTLLHLAGNTNGNVFIPSINEINFDNCTFTGVGYGINSRGSSNTVSKFTNCIIENKLGVTNLITFDECTFQDCVDANENIVNGGSVNIQTAKGVDFKDCVFDVTITESEYYLIRTNNGSGPITVDGGSISVDIAQGIEALDNTIKAGAILVQRGNDAYGSSSFSNVEINISNAALEAGLLLRKTSATIEGADIVVVTNISSTENNIVDLLAKSTGVLNAVAGDKYYSFEDGVQKALYDLSVIKVNSSWNENSTLEDGYVFGINAFASVDSVGYIPNEATLKIVEGASVSSADYTFMNTDPGDDYRYYDILTEETNYNAVVDGTWKNGQIVWNNADFAISETGFVHVSETFRVMGGNLSITGTRADGEDIPADLAPGHWGANFVAKGASLQTGYLMTALGNTAVVTDACIVITAGMFNVGWELVPGTAASNSFTLDNTYVLVGNMGDGTPSDLLVNKGSELILDSGSVIRWADVSGLSSKDLDVSVDADSSISIDASSSLFASDINNAGTIALEFGAVLNFNGILNNTGSITVDMTAADDEVVKLIDYSGNGTVADYGNVVLSNNAGGYQLVVNDNDLFAFNTDMSTIYVNAAWNSDFGADLGDGKYFGINAFNKVESITDKIKTDGGDTTVKFESNIEVVGQTVEFICGDGNLLFTADSAVTVSQKGVSDFGIMNTDTTVTVNKNVTFEIYDNNSGWYQYYGPGLELYGTITGGQNWGCTYLFNGNHTVHSTGTLSTGRIQLASNTFTVNGDTESDRTAAHIDTNYLLVEDGVFTANNAIVEAGIIHDSNNGGMRWGASEFYFNSSKLTGNMTIQYADSIVKFNNSDVTLGTLSNAGTVTVTGTSTLDIANLTGNAIQLAGGILKDSDINGNVQVTGESKMQGENTFADGAVVKVSGGKLTIDSNASVIGPEYPAGLPKNLGIALIAGNSNEPWMDKPGLTNKGAGVVDVAGELFAGQVHAAVDGTINVLSTGSVIASEMSAGVAKMTGGNAGIINIYGAAQAQLLSANAGGEIHVHKGADVNISVINNEKRKITISAGSLLKVAGGTVNVDIANKTTGGTAAIEVSGTMELTEGATVTVDRILPVESGWTTTAQNNYLKITSTGKVTATDSAIDVNNLIIEANGKLTASGVVFSADTVTNNGTITVTGTSTLNIGTLTGAIQLDNAELTASSINKGTVNFKGDNTFAGDFNAAYAYVGDWTNDSYSGSIDFGTETDVNVGGQMIIGYDSTVAGANKVVFGSADVETDKVFKSADVSVRRDGELIIQNTTGDNKINTMNVMGTVVIDDAKLSGEVQIGNSSSDIDAIMIVRNGAEVTLGGSSNSVVVLGKSGGGKLCIDNATVTVKNCGKGAGYVIPAETFVIGYQGGTGGLKLVNKAVFKAEYNVDARNTSSVEISDSTFTVDKQLTIAGDVTVTDSVFSAGSVKFQTVVEIDGLTAGDEREITLTFSRNGKDLTFIGKIGKDSTVLHEIVPDTVKLEDGEYKLTITDGSSVVTRDNVVVDKGDLDIYGASTVNIGKIALGKVVIHEGTVLSASNIGGDVIVKGNAEFSGNNTFDGNVKVINHAELRVAEDATVTGENACLYLGNSNEDMNGFGIPNGDTAGGKLTVDGSVNVNTLDANGGAEVVINGSVVAVGFHAGNGHLTGAKAAIVTVNGSVEAQEVGIFDGATVTVNGELSDADITVRGGKLNVNGGKLNDVKNIANEGSISVSGGTLNTVAILNNGTVTVTGNSTLNIGGEIANAGTITVDAGSKIFAQDITDNGSIVIEDTGYTGGFVTVIDLNGSASLKDRVVYNGQFKLFCGEDGDVILHDADMSTIFVNDDWTAGQCKLGDNVYTGAYYGVNAFGEMDEAAAVAASDSRFSVIQGIEGSQVSLHVDLKTENSDGLLVNMGNNGISFDKNGAYTLNGSTDFDTASAVGAEIGWTANDITIGENVTVNADVLVNTDNALRNIEGVLNVNGVMVRSADKANLIVSGELNVADNFVVTKGGDGGKTTVEDGGELTVDSIWVKAESYSFNIDGNAEVENFSSLGKVNVGGDLDLKKGISDIASLTASGKVDISEGADVTVGDVFVDKGGVIELDNAVLDVTTGTVLGDINVTDAKFTAAELVVNGCYVVSGFNVDDTGDREVTLVFFEKGSRENGRTFPATVKAGESFARFINSTILDGEYEITAVDGNESFMTEIYADKGDLNVYGNSSIEIDTLVGEVFINENAVLSKSEVKSGTVAVIGNAEMSGTNSLRNMYIAGTNADGSAAAVVVDESSTLNATIVSVGGTKGDSDFDKYFGGYYNNAAGAMDIAGTFNTEALALYKDGKMTVSGSVKAPEFYLRDASAVVEVEAGGTVTSVFTDVAGTMNLAGTLNIKGAKGEHTWDNILGIGGKLSVNGGTLNSNRGITVYEGGELNIANGKLIFSDLNGNDSKYNGTLTANGSVNVTGASVVKVDALVGTMTVANAKLTDSTVQGGTVAVTGNAEIAGNGNSLTNLYIAGTNADGSAATVKVTGTLNSTITSVGGTDGNSDLDKYFGGYYNNAAGAMDIAGTFNTEALALYKDGKMTVSGSVKAPEFYLRDASAVVEVKDGGTVTSVYTDVAGTMTVAGTLNVKGAKGEHTQSNVLGIGGKLSVNGGTVNSNRGVTVYEGGEVNITNGNLIFSDLNGNDSAYNRTLTSYGKITVAGNSTVNAAIVGDLTLADGVVISAESAISVDGNVNAAGDVTMKWNAITGADNFTVAGTLNLSGVTLPADGSSITLVDSKASFGGLSINGKEIIDDALFYVNGNEIDFYNVTYHDDKVTLDSAVYAGMSGEITGVTQAAGAYTFTVTPEIAGNIGNCTYSVSAYNADGKLLAAAEGLTVSVANNALLTSKLNFKVTATDELGSNFAFTTDSFSADVKDCTGPLFTSTPAAVLENGKLQISWQAFDAFGVEKYVITINGKKTTIEAYEKMTFGQNAIAGKNTYSIAAVDKNGYTTEVGGSLYVMSPAGNISGNAVTQIVGFDAARGAVGYIANEGVEAPVWKGIWEWGTDSSTAAVAVGNFSGSSADHAGLLFYNEETFAFGAWTDITDPSYGYVELGNAGSAVEVKAIGNFDGNDSDDILVEKEDGSISIMTDVKKYTAITSGNAVELAGAGSFGAANGLDSIVVEKNGEFQLWNTDDVAAGSWTAAKIMDADNQQLLDITGNWEVSAIGDFKGDGIDDIIMTAENGYSFLLNDGKTDSVEWSGEITSDFEVAGVGDYNGDGTEDLLLREMATGWGGLGYWNGGNAGAWVDLNARIETSDEDGHSGKFSVIAVVK